MACGLAEPGFAEAASRRRAGLFEHPVWASMMKVGLYQYSPVFGEVKTNLDRVTRQIESIECDLLVLPELAMTGYQFISREEVLSLSESVPDGPTTIRLSELARSRNMYVVAGLPERRNTQLFNSAILVGPQGFMGVYRKTHLFFEETVLFSPGDTGFPIWDIGLARIGILICFDWYYPESARTLALKGADILCHPSNLVLPHCPDAMVTRCLENRVYAITANRIGQEERGEKPPLRYIGKSEVVSPLGEVLLRASSDQPELLLCEIDVQEARRKSLNPYNDLWKDRKPHLYDLG